MSAAKTLLVVDDNEITREGLGNVLRREGYAVTLAASGGEVLQYLRTQPQPDLILLDMLMDEGDGWGVLRAVRTASGLSGIPVLIITGLGIANDEWATSIGAAGLLRKPFDTPDLLAAVRRCGGM